MNTRDKYKSPANQAIRENAIGRYRNFADQLNRAKDPYHQGTPVQNNTRIRWSNYPHLDNRRGIVYRLHATDLATLYPDGSMELHSHSWDSVTTRQRVNQLLSGQNAGSHHRFDSIPLACAPDKPKNPLEYVPVVKSKEWVGPLFKRPEDKAHLPVWTSGEILDWKKSERERIDASDSPYRYLGDTDVPCCGNSAFNDYHGWTLWGTKCPGCVAERAQKNWDSARADSDHLQAIYPHLEDWQNARREWLRANRETNKKVADWERAYVRKSNQGGRYFPGVGLIGRPYNHAKYIKRQYKYAVNQAIKRMQEYADS